jgi:lipoprotein-anchoring transpeptidase ErfK/SrfK
MVAALVAVATIVAAVLTVSAPARAGGPAGPDAAKANASARAPAPLSARRHAAMSPANAASTAPATPGQTTFPLTLTAGGQVTFGPVQMEPGPPGTRHQTPRGPFHVAWKAGPNFVSDIYHEPMPWATFFAAGGIAFHGGSLTRWSHGCVHLTLAAARYYNVHLPLGAEVVVF